MVKHNFWSVKRYLTKKIVKKKLLQKKIRKKKIIVKNLHNSVKKRVLGREKKNNQWKKICGERKLRNLKKSLPQSPPPILRVITRPFFTFEIKILCKKYNSEFTKNNLKSYCTML